MVRKNQTARGDRARENKPKSIDDVLYPAAQFEIPGHIVEAVGWSLKDGFLTHAKQLGNGAIEEKPINTKDSMVWLRDMMDASMRYGFVESTNDYGRRAWFDEIWSELLNLNGKFRQPCNRGFIPGWAKKHWGKAMKEKGAK